MVKTGNTETEPIWRRFLRHAAPLVLFVVLPLLIAGYLGSQTITNELDKHLSQAAGELDRRLVLAQYELDITTFLRKVGRGAWYKLRQNDGQAVDFKRYCLALRDYLPGEFDLYAYNERAELVTPPELRLRSKYIASRLWEILRSNPSEQNRQFLRIKKQLRTFVGAEFRISQFIEARDGCLPIIARHRHGMIYWINDPQQPASGLMFIFWDIPALKFRLSQVGQKYLKNFTAVFSVENAENLDNPVNYGENQIESKPAGNLFKQLVLQGRSFVVDDSERIWRARQIDDNWLIAAAPVDITRYHQMSAYLNGFLLLFGLLALILYIWSTTGARLYLPLRVKLLALFFLAVMMPIMGFAYLGYRYLDDREQTLRATVANNSRQLLFAMDESFSNAGASFIEDFAALSRRLAKQNDDRLKADIHDRIEKNDLISIELRDAQKAETLFFQQNELFFEGMREVSDAFSRYCIDNMLGSSLTDAIDPILDMVIRSPEAGMNFFFARPGEVHKMDFGPIPMFIFWEIFDADKDNPLYTFIVQSASRLLRRLVEQRFLAARKSRQAAPYLLVASSNRSGRWLPAPVKDAAVLREFVSHTQFSDKPVDTRVRLAGTDYLITGLHGRFASDYCLFAFYPWRLIAEDIAGQRRLIVSGILLFLLLAMLAAWMLSDVFLQPVSRLTEGVNAIKARNPDFRIISSQHDEFGDLALNFNHMIADLKEMQLAKDVQESLLPSEVPKVPGYDVSFANRMASAVGGDYFEVRVLDRERVCIIIGDVTGHGVGSALVMAMAKAVVYQGLKEERGLIEIIADLNQAVHAYFGVPPVRKMITFFAAMIDLASGQGAFANAGHNFPIKVGCDGTCSDLKAIGMPVGATARLRGLQLHSFELKPGEYVVFYTDGLVEVTNNQREMYGYDRIKIFLSEMPNQGAERVVAGLLQQYDLWLNNAEPDDDLTIVVFRRLAGNV